MLAFVVFRRVSGRISAFVCFVLFNSLLKRISAKLTDRLRHWFSTNGTALDIYTPFETSVVEWRPVRGLIMVFKQATFNVQSRKRFWFFFIMIQKKFFLWYFAIFLASELQWRFLIKLSSLTKRKYKNFWH